MQSTGQTDTHEMSITSMQGSAITYAMSGRSPELKLFGRNGERGSPRTGGKPTTGPDRSRDQPPPDPTGSDGAGASGTPASSTNRTGTTIPLSQCPGMWQPTNQPPAADAASAGTVHVMSTRSPDPATARTPSQPAGSPTVGVGPGGGSACAASAASQA